MPPKPKKIENLGNHRYGMEGLGAAVIEQAVEDLQKWSCHAQSAIYFFKKSPKLLEFWLSVATHQGRKQLDLDIARQRLYQKACEAEQNLLASHQKNLNTAQQLKQRSKHQR